MTNNLIDAIHNCRSVADNASYQLIDIADALNRLGMRDLSSELASVAERIVVWPREVSAAYSIEINSHLRHSEAMMGSLLRATMEGCIVAPSKARISKP